MKKLIYLIVLVLILGLTLVGCTLLSNIGQVPTTERKPNEGGSFLPGTLVAGKNTNVGDVIVWNDADNLYVNYVITDLDWCLTETHLHVATSLGEIPQKNGNPPPGKFDYKGEHDCVTEYTYTISLDWLPETELFIAAHAVVEYNETGTFMPDLAWQRSSEPTTFFFPNYGAEWIPAQAFAILLDPEQTVWDNGIDDYPNTPPITDGREWASWKYAYTEPDGGSYANYSDLRRFQATFTIPAGYIITSGSLYAPHFTGGIPINDNVYIFVNGEDNLLFWGGTRVNEIGGTFLGIPGIPALHGEFYVDEPMETGSWYIPGTIPDVTGFVSDSNSIDIFTEENEQWGGMGKLVLELDYELTYTETAWADGLDFPGKNWATYFNYTLQTAVQLNLLPWGSTLPIETGSGKVMLYNPTGDPNFIVQVDLEGAQIDHTYVVWINADGADLSPLVKSPTPGSTWYTLGNLFTNGSGDGSFYIGVNLVYSGILNNIEVALNEVSPYFNRKYSSELGTIVIN